MLVTRITDRSRQRLLQQTKRIYCNRMRACQQGRQLALRMGRQQAERHFCACGNRRGLAWASVLSLHVVFNWSEKAFRPVERRRQRGHANICFRE
ncbi:hypothetical protein HPB50_020421 [Hyalomma asiaticum]|uniref:Uncharacterized protein n=1 Tax=Hyalomma asiaticum TaxID=266040 RepID=A0ACB7SY68_HYAAI|nr:hypothetical protein HPB50_020421 [Hyalomma asiaticum]